VKTNKKIKFVIPILALILIFSFALACNGGSETSSTTEKTEETAQESEETEVAENIAEEETVEEEIIEEDNNNVNTEIEYEIIYTLNHLRYDDGISYYVLINPIDLSDDTFKENIKEIIRKIVEEKGKKIDIEIFDKRSSLENGYKDSKFDEAMNDLKGWENWFTDEISNDLAIHCIATFSGENDYDLYFNTLYFFIYSGYAENSEIDKYVAIIQFNP